MSRIRRPLVLLIAITTLLGVPSIAGPQRKAEMKATEVSDVTRGEKLYEKICAICHFATSPEKKIGPGLRGLMKKEKFSNGWKVNDENLRRWIENGGKNMPPSRLNAEQIRELIEYVKTL